MEKWKGSNSHTRFRALFFRSPQPPAPLNKTMSTDPNPHQSHMGSGDKQGESLQEEVAGAKKLAVEKDGGAAEKQAMAGKGTEKEGGFGKGEEAGAGGAYKPGEGEEGEPGGAAEQAEAGGFSA